MSCTNTALNERPVPDWKSRVMGRSSLTASHVPKHLEIQGNMGHSDAMHQPADPHNPVRQKKAFKQMQRQIMKSPLRASLNTHPKLRGGTREWQKRLLEESAAWC